jgi:sec-independent protein translocase protein TatA
MQPLFAIFMGGPWELIIVLFIILLLFGHKLPKMMRSMGQGVVEFKKGVQGVEDGSDEAKKEKIED